ncbi:MAG: 5'/3'-nucleotidase SurE [Acidimicrobiia bacterium]|nr:5'/3'-nucleotidase SurE [Acidimicrobiia bacterium]
MNDGWTLLTNDDGAQSPALVPFAAALATARRVRVVVPDRERSWSGKALSRFDELRVRDLSPPLDGWAHSGLPADGVQLGVRHLAPSPPSLVVSGINVGHNHGAAYLWSSGTVGAAIEGWALGVPAVAFSTGTTTDWESWRAAMHAPDGKQTWDRLAEVACAVLTEIITDGTLGGADVVNVNLPEGSHLGTERRRTSVAPTGYGGIFAPSGEDRFAHSYDGILIPRGDLRGTDVEAAHDGAISITQLRLGG